MRNYFFLLVLALSATAWGQVNTPAPSPFQKVEQKVGLTDITLEYSRPSMKGRKVFGDLVPYGPVWRTGANANTKITFSSAVTIGGKTLEPGTYALYSKPGEKSWEIIFYSDATNWGNPRQWDESKVAASVSSQVWSMDMPVETFTITFDDLSNNSVNLGIIWENTYVRATIEVPTDDAVMASIDRTMAGPSGNDYYAAAVYYLQEGKNMKQAQEWIDKAISMRKDPAFWMYRQKSLIHAKMGDKQGAIAAAKTSLELAEKAGNKDYIALNQKSLKEWGAK
ncbi:DUF2911 domain-containing protein [Gilvibacter sediminis]|uniref:DUF2911 domain-containing protein n=1 Tax=Gilvibacter sediminis TaxID=379071 RepID=UPI0023510258|nr:DUF2911 domain-containing protein [Gilvibacter sediminis]MDC7998186.1 DUF2911 domain-containing protein [Gilvibacter sediminis]